MTGVVGRTWRPRGVIITAAVFTLLFAGGSVIGWFGLPESTRVLFSFAQIATLLGILAVMLIVMWLLAGSVVHATEDGLQIRNGWMRRQLAWQEIERVRLRPGDPWAVAILRSVNAQGEPRTAVLFGLQGSEGAAARTAVASLNDEIARRSQAA